MIKCVDLFSKLVFHLTDRESRNGSNGLRP